MFCRKCGKELLSDSRFCDKCGTEVGATSTEPAVAGEQEVREDILPEEFRKWNWGAFTFTFIWGLFNRTYSAFWVFVPVVGIVMAFVLGAKGNEWAWKNKHWEDLEHFDKVQGRWAEAALYFLVFTILLALAVWVWY